MQIYMQGQYIQKKFLSGEFINWTQRGFYCANWPVAAAAQLRIESQQLMQINIVAIVS